QAPRFFEKTFKDLDGNTPFHHVSNIQDEKLRKEMAQILIVAGMDIELTNKKGEKPKHYQEFLQIQKANAKPRQDSLAEKMYFKRSQMPEDLFSTRLALICYHFGMIALGITLLSAGFVWMGIITALPVAWVPVFLYLDARDYAKQYQAQQQIKKQQAKSELIY